jgi:hypothetical protein
LFAQRKRIAMPLSSSHRVFAISPPQQLVDEVFPAWRRGASLLRDEDDRICGTLRFSREPGGGLELEIGPEVPSELDAENAVIQAASELARLRHGGECVLVRVLLCREAGGPLEVIDFDPRDVAVNPSCSSVVSPSLPSGAAG